MSMGGSSIVRTFRSLERGRKKFCVRNHQSTGNLFRETQQSVGTLHPNDCHAILVSLSKLIKIHKSVHPVRAAPLASALIERIINCPFTEFRTVAGTFGLISRVGIDWRIHLGGSNTFLQSVAEIFKTRTPMDLGDGIDKSHPSDIGYCCELAGYLGIHSPEFTETVTYKFITDPSQFQPLPTVLLTKYLSQDAIYETVPNEYWTVLDRHVCGESGKTFTPQNALEILKSTVRIGKCTESMVNKLLKNVSGNSGFLRLSDCIDVLDICRSVGGSDEVLRVISAVKRRTFVLLATSTSSHIVSRHMAQMRSILGDFGFPRLDIHDSNSPQLIVSAS